MQDGHQGVCATCKGAYDDACQCECCCTSVPVPAVPAHHLCISPPWCSMGAHIRHQRLLVQQGVGGLGEIAGLGQRACELPGLYASPAGTCAQRWCWF